MKNSFSFLMEGIMILFLCLMVALAFGGMAVGSWPQEKVVAIPLFIMTGVMVWLGVFLFIDQLKDYRRMRADERKPDQHDWPFVQKKGYQKFHEPGSSVTIRKS